MVHLDKDPAVGPTVNPVVECPLCGRTWIAAGTQFLLKVPVNGTDQEQDAAIEAIVEQIQAHVRQHGNK